MNKRDLKRIINLNDLINSKLRQLDNLKSILYSVKSIQTDETGVSGTNISKPTESSAIRIVELSEEINKDIDLLVELKQEAKECFRELDPKYQLVMELRYMECLTWKEISNLMGYGIDNIYRLHGQALKTIQ